MNNSGIGIADTEINKADDLSIGKANTSIDIIDIYKEDKPGTKIGNADKVDKLGISIPNVDGNGRINNICIGIADIDANEVGNQSISIRSVDGVNKPNTDIKKAISSNCNNHSKMKCPQFISFFINNIIIYNYFI